MPEYNEATKRFTKFQESLNKIERAIYKLAVELLLLKKRYEIILSGDQISKDNIIELTDLTGITFIDIKNMITNFDTYLTILDKDYPELVVAARTTVASLF